MQALQENKNANQITVAETREINAWHCQLLTFMRRQHTCQATLTDVIANTITRIYAQGVYMFIHALNCSWTTGRLFK